MNESMAREILKNWTIGDSSLHHAGLPYVDCTKSYTILDGDFTADELEAIVWWMRNKNSTIVDVDKLIPPIPDPPQGHLILEGHFTPPIKTNMDR